MEYSPLLGGFAVVLADGRGGFLSADTANFECSVSIICKLHEFCDVYDFLTASFAEVSLRTWHQANCTAVSMISPLPWFDHLGESFPYKEDEFKTVCPSVKNSCSPAENINETPALTFRTEPMYILSFSIML